MPPIKRKISRVGLDLDNTLIDYGLAYAALAPQFGIPSHKASRDLVRSALRGKDENDEEWQHFQTLLYTQGLSFATSAPGLKLFLETCRAKSVSTFIISHKSERGPARFGDLDLRAPAMEWLIENQVVPGLCAGDNVVFADTRKAKVQVIGTSDLDIFVDDLVDVLAHPEWPAKTLGVRYHSGDWCLSGEQWSAGFEALTRWLLS